MLLRILCLFIPLAITACTEPNEDTGFFTRASTNVGLLCRNDDAADSAVEDKKDFSSKAIYGEDNRLDWYESPGLTKDYWAKSTLSLMSSSNLVPQEGGGFVISAPTYQSTANLCDGQPFLQQPSAGYCSGFLVAPDLIVTAGHCVYDMADCRSTRFVFDYAKTEREMQEYFIPENSVYQCEELVRRKTGSDDYAVIRLNRPVEDRVPLNVRRDGAAAFGDQVMLIGHPMGLPSKIADGGFVQSVGNTIVASVDAFAANSGSVIINSATGIVEGILVAGEADFRYQNGCRVEAVCGNDCGGEVITPISKVLPHIPDVYYDNPVCEGE